MLFRDISQNMAREKARLLLDACGLILIFSRGAFLFHMNVSGKTKMFSASLFLFDAGEPA
jgi:hypothetical protein